jgi:hypothetical protein
VEMASLDIGQTRQYTKPFRDEQLVSDAAPLYQLLASLKAQERVFAVLGAGVKGIVTRADLNKPPVDVYAFGLISLMEMHLRYWGRRSYPGDSWQDKLSQERLNKAKELQDERRRRKDDIALIDCLQFCDLRELLLGLKELRTTLQLRGKNKTRELLDAADELRNRLAHSQQDIVKDKSWQEMIDLIERIEGVVASSDDMLEQQARSVQPTQAALWVAGA